MVDYAEVSTRYLSQLWDAILRHVEFAIDATSPVHGYRQLANQLREKIQNGTITVQLPSLTKLVEDSGLSMSTVQHAVRVLAEEGLVTTVRGRGNFVRREGLGRS